MQFTSTIVALTTALLPSVLALPAQHDARATPTCGADQCLPASFGGKFYSCGLSDLSCLCKLPQAALTLFVTTVQPCLDGSIGQAACTPGAIYQYKGLLSGVCALDQFGAKSISWPALPVNVLPAVLPAVVDTPIATGTLE